MAKKVAIAAVGGCSTLATGVAKSMSTAIGIWPVTARVAIGAVGGPSKNGQEAVLSNELQLMNLAGRPDSAGMYTFR